MLIAGVTLFGVPIPGFVVLAALILSLLVKMRRQEALDRSFGNEPEPEPEMSDEDALTPQ